MIIYFSCLSLFTIVKFNIYTLLNVMVFVVLCSVYHRQTATYFKTRACFELLVVHKQIAALAAFYRNIFQFAQYAPGHRELYSKRDALPPWAAIVARVMRLGSPSCGRALRSTPGICGWPSSSAKSASEFRGCCVAAGVRT